jgi:EmrB/QacA subfamily drug resistance transporter
MSRRKGATAGILVGLLLAALDGTVVATALPQILDELKGLQIYFYPTAVFMLCQTVSMPIWGRLSDMYGRSKFHLAAVLLLIGGSILCARSWSMGSLIAFRAIQALGAGGIMALSFTMIADLYDLEERAKMQGAISSVWGLAALIGPALGAWVTKAWKWQGVFYLNVPVGILSALLVQASWVERPREGKPSGRPDIAGAVLLALASVSLLGAVNVTKDAGWLSRPSLVGFAVTIVLFASLVVIERRVADPFIAYDLFRSRLFSTGAATGVCAMLCLFAAIMHVPLLVAGVMGKDLRTGGNMLTCMMLPWMVCSALTKPLLKRFSYRTLAIVGMLFAGASYGLLANEVARSTLAPVIASMVILGTGLGLTVAPLLIAAQNAVTKDRLGAATSLTQFTRSMGAAIGLTLMGALFAAAFEGREPESLIAFRAQADPSRLKQDVGHLVLGLRKVFFAGIGVAALGFLLALAIPSGKAQDLKVPAPVPEG